MIEAFWHSSWALCHVRDPSIAFCTWIDSFNYKYYYTPHRVANSGYIKRQCAVEARLVNIDPDCRVDCSLKFIDGEIVPILPRLMCDRTVANDVIDECVNLFVPTFLLNETLHEQYGIESTRPMLDVTALPSHYQAAALRGNRFMARFLPINVHGINIASDVGLVKLVAKLRDLRVHAPYYRNYHVFVVDVKTYERGPCHVMYVSCMYSILLGILILSRCRCNMYDALHHLNSQMSVLCYCLYDQHFMHYV